MRRLAAAAATALLLTAGCADTEQRPQTGTANAAGEPDWAVTCHSADATPIAALDTTELPCLGDGDATALGVRDGRPLVMPLWASWCEPCRDEAPELQAFYETVGDRIDVVGIVTQDDAVRARWFAEEYGMTYPSVDDREATLQKAFGVGALPGIVFIAPDGTVAATVIDPGVTTEDLLATAESAFGMELT